MKPATGFRLPRLPRTLRLLPQRIFGTPGEREEAGFVLAERLTWLLYPKYIFSEFGRIWLDDLGFREYYERLCGRSDWHSADRKFFLRSLLRLADGLEGDTAECGAYKGASSYLICEHFAAAAKLHHVFDSFEGLSSPGLADGQYWKAGDLTSGDDVLRRSLSAFPNLRVYPGWIPSRFGEVENSRFCFVHIDVDLHDPTLQSLEFFYPRMVPGGVLLFDDYGFSSCPGARQATDEFMRGRPEGLVHVPTGQAFVVKR